jgi:hypothetical protein
MSSYTVKTPNGNVKITKKSDFEEVPTKVILSMHNDLTGKETKKFPSRAKGIEQTWVAFQAHVEGDQVSADVADDSEPEAEGTTAKPTPPAHGRIKMSATDTIVFKTIDNPFRPNSLVFERWAKVKDGMTVEKALEKADGPTRGDIRWAFHKGYIELTSAAE